MYNIMIGGAAGDGIETTTGVLEKFLQRQGYYFFTYRDFMSRVRGGHNFSQIRFGEHPVAAHRDMLDVLVVLDEESYQRHQADVKTEGVIFHDSSWHIEDIRASALPFKDLATKLGNVKMSGAIIVGVLLKFFGLKFAEAEKIFAINLKDKLIEANVEALKTGFELGEVRLQVPEGTKNKGYIALTGANALSLGAIAADVRFYSAYPMSPATTMLDYFQAQSEFLGITVEQAEDEIAAVNMALGASYAGAKAMTGTSGGGFSLMVEALGFSGIAEIPVVIVDAQRPGPATGLPTRTEQSDLKFVISASQGEFPRLVIAIRSHEDAFYQTARAVELAYKYQIPVIVLTDQYLADSVCTIPQFEMDKLFKAKDIPQHKEGEQYLRYKLTTDGISPNLVPGKTSHVVCVDSDEHDEYGHITESAYVRVCMADKRMRKLELLKKELLEPEFIGAYDFETLLVGFGSTHGAIKEVVKALNRKKKGKYAALVFGDVYPLPLERLKECASREKMMINVEQNATGQLASLIRETTLLDFDASILKYDGRQMSVDYILVELKKIEQERG